MWRVHRLDQINALKPANPFDFKSLTLKFRSKRIGRFKTVREELTLKPSVRHISAVGDKQYAVVSPDVNLAA